MAVAVCGESRTSGDNGGMRRRIARYRALSLPTGMAELPEVRR